MAAKYARGSCYCGKVSYKVALPVAWEGHCHCTQCQRLHGAAFVTWTAFDTEDFHIDDPHDCFGVFSGKVADHGFCRHCGSHLMRKYHSEAPEAGEGINWVYVTRATISTPLKSKSLEHIHLENAAPWGPVNVLDENG